MKLKTKFQDEDFDLGEVVEANIYYGGSRRIKVIAKPAKGGIITFYFESLKELNEMFEDYEEPKEYWHIFGTNITKTQEGLDEIYDKRNKEIGNYFETKEEAEKAVEKLKAWKRLKDKGFKFVGRSIKDLTITYSFDNYDEPDILQMNADLDLLFGGEE